MTEDPTPVAEITRAPRWMVVVLVVSLAVNLLVAGMILGALVGRDRGDRIERSSMSRDLGRTPFVMALDPEDRRALGRALMRDAAPLQANRAELRERFESLLAALRAETFDRAAVAQLIADQRTAATRRQEIGEAALLDFLESMSPEARRDYADRLDRSLRRGP